MIACRRLLCLAASIGGVALFLTSGIAAADPPGRVARMANVGGAVSFSPAGEDEWVPAMPNRPVSIGDRVWTDEGARAELQIGSLAVRLGGQTSVSVLNLDDSVAQFELGQGALNVRVRRIDPGQTIEIDTPLLAFELKLPGDYRIDVDGPTGATTVSVRSGEGEAYGDGAAYSIGARQWYRFVDSGLRDYLYDAPPPPDAFDAWTRDRDRREDNPVAARYVSPEVVGYSDLDAYGTWSTVEGYGNVWVPTSVASDWAPYRDGHWAWIEPWGWTWVDDAPWGFAPFHYGRWAYARERWCWVPGPARVRPVYAPALVAFVGGSSLRVAGGSSGPSRGVAWFPLAPGEVYRPGYNVSRGYFTNVNVSNTNVTNHDVTSVYNRPEPANVVYRNREQRGGVTAMPAAAFVQSRPVAQFAVPLSREVATAGPVTPVASIAPVRQSVFGPIAVGGSAGPGPAARPPATITQRPVVARVAPPPRPASFVAREPALTKEPGRPSVPETMVAPRNAAAPVVAPVRVVTPAVNGTPPPAPTVARPRTNAPGAPNPGGAPAGPASSGPPPAPPSRGQVPGPQTPAVQTVPPSRPGPGAQPVRPELAPPGVPAPASAPAAPPGQIRAAPPAPPIPAPPGVEPRREPSPLLNRPPPTSSPTPADLRREPPPSPPAASRGPVAPAPPSPPSELRREPVPVPSPAAVPAGARPPAPPQPPPAEFRRESPTAPPPAVVRPPAPNSPVIQPVPPAPQMVRAPAATPAAQPPVHQPESKAPPAPAKNDVPRSKPDDKRDEPK